VLRAAGVTNRGRVRSANQDCFGIDEGLCLCVVADGMGGHNAGDVAARIAVDAVTGWIRRVASGIDACGPGSSPIGVDPSLSEGGNLLRTAIYLAHLRVVETAAAMEAYAGMGTTIVAALVRGDRLSVGHAGDSRCYLYDRFGIRQLTVDDSWIAQASPADRAQLSRHPLRHALTNVLGGRQGAEVHVTEEALTGGELMALTTDGVHTVLDEVQIGRTLREGPSVAHAASRLVQTALHLGSRDNCTAVAAQYLPD
jgi:protein phosphatase